MKKGDAWMPLYVGDYLADTSRLKTLEHGAYMLILMDYWRKGPPPNDDETLMTVAKVGARAWPKVRASIAPFFEVIAGRWIHKRLEHERQKAMGISAKRREIGRSGGMAKAEKTVASEVAIATVNGVANGYQTPTPSPSQSPTAEEKKAASPRFDPLTLCLPDCVPPEKWAEWITYRRERGLTTGRRSAEKQLEALTGWAAAGQSVDVIIDTSIRNQWQGLFEQKANGHGRTNPLHVPAGRTEADYLKGWE